MSTRRALAFSLLDRYASQLLAIVSIVVLSRLLSPREIGLFAVAMVFVSLLSSLRDFGAGQYLVQVPGLDTQTVRAVWTVQLLLGASLAAIVVLTAPVIARYFGEPEAESIMQIVAFNFALTPFGSVTYAWLTRNMKFGQLAILRFSGALAGTLVSIGLAAHGLGAISLAWGHVAGAAATAVAALRFRPRELPWLPGIRGTGAVLVFGSRSTMYAILQTLRVEAPLFVLGRFRDVAEAGLFSRANGFMTLPQTFLLNAVHAVTLPLFARIEREGGRVEQAFLLAVTHTTALGWSFALAAALLADPFIRILYGDQWLAAVPLLRVLALAGGLGMPLYFCAQILISKGFIARNVINAALSTGATLLLVLTAAPAGVLAVTWACVGAMLVTALVWARAVERVMTLSRRDVVTALARSLAAAAGANVAPALVIAQSGWSPASPGLALVVAVPGGLLGFVLALRTVSHPLYGELNKGVDAVRLWRQHRT